MTTEPARTSDGHPSAEADQRARFLPESSPAPSGDRRPVRRLHIDHLDLDLRGVHPQTAEAALDALGPALVRAMRGRRLTGTSEARLDGGAITLDHPADATALATRLAHRLAERLTGDGP